MLSDEKVTHMSHMLLREMLKKELVRPLAEEAAIRKAIKRAIAGEVKAGEEIDKAVRRKLESYSRKIVEGSPEWEVLYRKFYNEEEGKRGRAEG